MKEWAHEEVWHVWFSSGFAIYGGGRMEPGHNLRGTSSWMGPILGIQPQIHCSPVNQPLHESISILADLNRVFLQGKIIGLCVGFIFHTGYSRKNINVQDSFDSQCQIRQSVMIKSRNPWTDTWTQNTHISTGVVDIAGWQRPPPPLQLWNKTPCLPSDSIVQFASIFFWVKCSSGWVLHPLPTTIHRPSANTKACINETGATPWNPSDLHPAEPQWQPWIWPALGTVQVCVEPFKCVCLLWDTRRAAFKYCCGDNVKFWESHTSCHVGKILDDGIGVIRNAATRASPGNQKTFRSLMFCCSVRSGVNFSGGFTGAGMDLGLTSCNFITLPPITADNNGWTSLDWSTSLWTGTRIFQPPEHQHTWTRPLAQVRSDPTSGRHRQDACQRALTFSWGDPEPLFWTEVRERRTKEAIKFE